MLEKMIRLGFGVSIWTAETGMFVKLLYNKREVRMSFKKSKPIDEALVAAACELAERFPGIVPESLLK